MTITSVLTVPGLQQRAAATLPRIAAESAEREASRRLPTQEVRHLMACGLGTWRVPAEFGGPAASISSLFDFIVDLGAADPNIAQAIRSHFGFVEMLRQCPSREQQRHWFTRVLRGDLFAIASGERSGAQGEIQTRLRKHDDKLILTGEKYYSTGVLYADWVSVRALDDDNHQQSVVIPTTCEGVDRVDDWDAVGQRLTASGTTRLDSVHVDEDAVLTAGAVGTGRTKAAPYLQLFLAAIEVGIARNALTDAVDFTQRHARPIKHGLADRSIDDPYVQHAIGEMSARVYTAEAGVRRAAEVLGRVDQADEDSVAAHEALLTASIEVAQAQFIAVESAMKVGELLFDVAGASITERSHNLDRHWRNARTLANHNPRAYKARTIGAFHLDGVEPPTSGFF